MHRFVVFSFAVTLACAAALETANCGESTWGQMWNDLKGTTQRFREGYSKSGGHTGDKLIEGMIETATPEADESTRKVQRDAVKFMLDPNSERSKGHLDRMVNGVREWSGEDASARGGSSSPRSNSGRTQNQPRTTTRPSSVVESPGRRSVTGAGSRIPIRTFPEDSAPEGLLAYFPFDEDALDRSGTGHRADGGMPAPGIAGGGRRVDRSEIRVPLARSLPLDEHITVAFWFRYEGSSGGRDSAGLLSYGSNDGSGNHAYLTIRTVGDSGRIYAEFHGMEAHTSSVARSDVPLPRGEWVHITAVYRKGTAWLYIHDARGAVLSFDRDSNSGTGPIRVNSGEPLRIGAHSAFGSSVYRRIRGIFDEVRVYNRALSETEIVALARGRI